jgi:hypothetical protein
MIRDVKMSDDCIHPADYFDYQEMESEQKARGELAELQHLLALPCHAWSYSRQAANTRDLVNATQSTRMASRVDAYSTSAIPSIDTECLHQ